MDLTRKILNFADTFDMLPESANVLACVSGGADSMCLLAALLDISGRRRISVSAAHFNHKLRGAESDMDERFVRDRCAELGVPFLSESGDVSGYAGERGMGIEEAAREMRYCFFRAAALRAGATRIATAHTADDNSETMLLNLARGSGAAGLAGIPPVRGAVVRPMLRVSRDEVEEFLRERGIQFVHDSTNDSDVYSRNKLRHNVIPALKEINPGFAAAAATAAELIRADEEYLSSLADEFIAAQSDNTGARCALRLVPRPAALVSQVSIGELNKLPFAISSRVIRKLHGSNLDAKHVRAALMFCDLNGPPARLPLPGAAVFREYGNLVFDRRQLPCGLPDIHLADEDDAAIPGTCFRVSCRAVVCEKPVFDRVNKSFTSFLFKTGDLCGRMTVRSRREGDFIRIHGRGGSKTLKKLFNELRVPARERSLIPVLADDGGVLAICGVGRGDRAAPDPGDQAYYIEFKGGPE